MASWQHSDGNPQTRALNADGVRGKNRESEPYLASLRVVNAATG